MWEGNDILNNFYKSVINSIPIGAIAVNSELVIADMNPAMERISGLSQRYLLGLPLGNLFFTLFEQACAQGLIDKLQGILTTKTPLSTEASFSKERGECICSITATPLASEEEAVMGILLMVEDITERKQVKTALVESEEKFRTITTSAKDAIIMLDNDGNISFWNKAAEEIFGYSSQEVLGQEYHTLLGPKHYYEAYRKGFSYFKTTGQVPVIGKTFELTALRKDGTEFPIELSLSAVKVKGKWNAIGILRDITEQKKLTQTLQKSKEQLEEVSLNIPGAVYQFYARQDGEWGLYYVSKKVKEIFGMLPELEGFFDRFYECVVDEDKERFAKSIKKAVKEVSEWDFEGRFRKPSGEILWFKGNSLPSKHEKEIVFNGVLLDITSRKQAEEDLKKYRDHLEELVEERTKDLAAERERLAVTLRAIDDGVITTDVEGKVVLINKAAEKLTGWTQRDASGKPLSEVFHIINEKTGKRCDDPVKKVLESGGIVGLANDTALIARDGANRLIDDSGAPIYDKDNRIIGAVLVFRDVTEKRAMQEEILKGQKLESLGILAGGIAHDFNNILTTILGNINLAQMYYPQQADKVLEKLETAERASLRAKDLTQQLLTFARGGAPIKKIASIVKLLKETTTFALSGANVRSEFSLPDALWPIECDPGQISQVIDNLIINAREAMPQGGIVEVKAENIIIEAECALPLPEGKYIKVVIKDHGPGISKAHFQKIFDPFFTTKEEGRGLGLTTVHSIIKRHGGYIELESEPDAGTTFYIYLPASGEKLIEEKEVDRIFRGKGKILLMDDETDVRKTTGGLLKYIGYEVEFAGDGAEAIELYKKAKASGRPFEAVILDLTIPGGMGGKEAIKKLIEIDPEVRAIVSSGYSNDPIMADFREYGFSSVVSKPYKIEELSQALRVEK